MFPKHFFFSFSAYRKLLLTWGKVKVKQQNMINVVGSNYQAVSYHLDSSYTHLTVTCQEVERQKIIYQDQYERSLDLNHFIQKIENFFFYLGFLSRTFTIRRTQVDSRDNKSSSLSPLYLFHALHRLLDINRVIIVESSPLHIASSRARAGNL